MLVPSGSVSILDLETACSSSRRNEEPDPVITVLPNRERLLFAVLTQKSFTIFSGHPKTKLASVRRSRDCLKDKGYNTGIQWKINSELIAISSSRGFILFYRLEFPEGCQSYQLHDPTAAGRGGGLSRRSAELFWGKPIPAIKVRHDFSVQLPLACTKLLVFRDELLATTSDGSLRRLQWNGLTCASASDDLSGPSGFSLQKVPFHYDQLQSKAEYLPSGIHIVDLVYSPLVSGFAAVFSSGQAALLTANVSATSAGHQSQDFNLPRHHQHQRLTFGASGPGDAAGNIRGIWAPRLVDANATAIAHKYRLIVFGTRGGRITGWVVDQLMCCQTATGSGAGSGGAAGGLLGSPSGTVGTGALLPVYDITLEPTIVGNDAAERLGAVTSLRWSPCGSALLSVWASKTDAPQTTKSGDPVMDTGGGLAIWTTFGSLIWTSVCSDDLDETDGRQLEALNDHASAVLLPFRLSPISNTVTAADWGYEAFDIWVAGLSSAPIYNEYNKPCLLGTLKCLRTVSMNGLSGVSHLKSDTGDPRSTTSDAESDGSALFLLGEEEFFISRPSLTITVNGGGLWDNHRIPYAYLGPNWPLRYAAYNAPAPGSGSGDSGGGAVVVSGARGLAWLSLRTRRWKLFGNETQERDFVVAGGLAWWRGTDFIVACCFNLNSISQSSGSGPLFRHTVAAREEIRFYPTAFNLDNIYASICPLADHQQQTLSLQIKNDVIILLDVAGRVYLYSIEIKGGAKTKLNVPGSSGTTTKSDSVPTVQIIKHTEVILSELIPHPACVIDLQMSSLFSNVQTHSAAAKLSPSATSPRFFDDVDTLFINIAGKLIMVRPEAKSVNSNGRSDNASSNTDPANSQINQLSEPQLVVASSVERFWANPGIVSPDSANRKPHLAQSVWIHCGAAGTKVWMPLFPNPVVTNQNQQQQASHSRFDKHHHVSGVKYPYPTPNDPGGKRSFSPVPIPGSAKDATNRAADLSASHNSSQLQQVRIQTGPTGPTPGTSSFLSRRIMLPLELNFTPLHFDTDACIAFGLESDVVTRKIIMDSPMSSPVKHTLAEQYHSTSEPSVRWKDREMANDDKFIGRTSTHLRREHHRWLAYIVFKQSSQVVLNHILKQLLKRNLGAYALQIAATCSDLPHFSHVLELLLHVVLEEEATSSEPIPDPLLPRVAAFIQEFPQALDVIAHCARKTETNLWNYLFRHVGVPPRDLFNVCIREAVVIPERLQTAASLLIVHQNLESGLSCKDVAVTLLQTALLQQQWSIAVDVVRFLSSIDPDDMEAVPAAQFRSASGFLTPSTPSGEVGSSSVSRNSSAKPTTGQRFTFSNPLDFEWDGDQFVDSISLFRINNGAGGQQDQRRKQSTPDATCTGTPTDVTTSRVRNFSFSSENPTATGEGNAATTAKRVNKSRDTDDVGRTKPRLNGPGASRKLTNIESPVSPDKRKSLHKSISDPRYQGRARYSNVKETPLNPIQFQVDVILRSYAKELLGSARLGALGQFSAYLDFHLVLWLGKERNDTARVDSWVGALTNLHTDFSWPYPTLININVHPGNGNTSLTPSSQFGISGNSINGRSPKSVSDDDVGLRESVDSVLKQSVREKTAAGDTPKSLMETRQLLIRQQQYQQTLKSSGKTGTVKAPPTPGATVLDAPLSKLNYTAARSSSNYAGTEGTLETESMFDDELMDDTTSWQLDWDPALEHLMSESLESHHNNNSNQHSRQASTSPGSVGNGMPRGGGNESSRRNSSAPSNAMSAPAKSSQVRLRYLQHVFSESGCVEWLTIVCLALRDLVTLARWINPSSMTSGETESDPELPPEQSLTRLQAGIAELQGWAETQCPGYMPLLRSAQRQFEVCSERLGKSGGGESYAVKTIASPNSSQKLTNTGMKINRSDPSFPTKSQNQADTTKETRLECDFKKPGPGHIVSTRIKPDLKCNNNNNIPHEVSSNNDIANNLASNSGFHSDVHPRRIRSGDTSPSEFSSTSPTADYHSSSSMIDRRFTYDTNGNKAYTHSKLMSAGGTYDKALEPRDDLNSIDNQNMDHLVGAYTPDDRRDCVIS